MRAPRAFLGGFAVVALAGLLIAGGWFGGRAAGLFGADRDERPIVRLTAVGGVTRLASGAGHGMSLRLPAAWGLAERSTTDWVNVARQGTCEAAVLSALYLPPGTGSVQQRLQMAAHNVLWSAVGRDAGPGRTFTRTVDVAAGRGVFAADFMSHVAVFTLRPRGRDSRPGTIAVVAQGTPGPFRGCDRRRVGLTPGSLARLISGLQHAG